MRSWYSRGERGRGPIHGHAVQNWHTYHTQSSCRRWASLIQKLANAVMDFLPGSSKDSRAVAALMDISPLFFSVSTPPFSLLTPKILSRLLRDQMRYYDHPRYYFIGASHFLMIQIASGILAVAQPAQQYLAPAALSPAIPHPTYHILALGRR